MTSFRKELNAVRKSLPNQFETNHFADESNDWGAAPGRREPPATKKSMASPRSSKTSSDLSDSQKYFKNDWNLKFQDQENQSKEASTSHPLPKQSTAGNVEQKMIDYNKTPNSMPRKNESFPEYPEMPFDRVHSEEIEINQSASPLDTESNGQSKKADVAMGSVTSAPNSTQELKSVDATRNADRESTGDSNESVKSNYEEDMDLVRKLLSKYGENFDEKLKLDKARRIHAIVDIPTDAYFHRHAAGMCRKSPKSSPKPSTSKVVEISTQPQSKNEIREMPPAEEPKEPQGTAPQVSTKKVNRVHFKTPAVDVTAEKPPAFKRFNSLTVNIPKTDDVRQPVNRNAVTTRPAQSPMRPAQSPLRPTKAPLRPTLSPRRRPAQSPLRPTRSTGRSWQSSPVRPAQSSGKVPVRSTQSPVRSAQSPIRPSQSPARPPQSPGKVSDKIKFWEGK